MGRRLPGRALAARLAAGLLRGELRSAFRRVVWVGEDPRRALPPGRPAVLYANHHGFHDGHLLWALGADTLRRPLLVWMREWERAPLFGPLGALPFPEGDPAARRATVRETGRRLREDPRTLLLYFPEGDIRPPDAGLGPFDGERFARLARVLPPETVWWPVALRLTWWGEDRPTALLTGAPPHDAPDGAERDRLAEALSRLHAVRPGDGAVLMEGRPSIHERWDLRRLAPLFRRWT